MRLLTTQTCLFPSCSVTKMFLINPVIFLLLHITLIWKICLPHPFCLHSTRAGISIICWMHNSPKTLQRERETSRELPARGKRSRQRVFWNWVFWFSFSHGAAKPGCSMLQSVPKQPAAGACHGHTSSSAGTNPIRNLWKSKGDPH